MVRYRNKCNDCKYLYVDDVSDDDLTVCLLFGDDGPKGHKVADGCDFHWATLAMYKRLIDKEEAEYDRRWIREDNANG